MGMRPLVLALLLPGLAAAQDGRVVDTGRATRTGYDEFRFIGFSQACSAAIEYFSYPPTGKGLQGVPEAWKIGTITLDPGSKRETESWRYAGVIQEAWRRAEADMALETLAREGYDRPGAPEKVRDAPLAKHPDLARILPNPRTFQLGYRTQWPEAPWRLAGVHYHPLGNCALVLFRDERRPRDSWRWKLVKILNPGVRRKRARAHLTNGLLLYEAADIYGALEEAAIAAAMDPGYAAARYHHAVLLAAHGKFDQALVELEAAVAADPDFKAKAREAVEFERLRGRPGFRRLTDTDRHKWLVTDTDEPLDEFGAEGRRLERSR